MWHLAAECGEGVGNQGLVVGGAERSKKFNKLKTGWGLKDHKMETGLQSEGMGVHTKRFQQASDAMASGFQQGPLGHSVQGERRWDLP